jgi:hypothetical protein
MRDATVIAPVICIIESKYKQTTGWSVGSMNLIGQVAAGLLKLSRGIGMTDINNEAMIAYGIQAIESSSLSKSGVVSLAVVDHLGRAQIIGSQICHGGLYDRPRNKEEEIVVSRFQDYPKASEKWPMSKDQFLRYIDYCANRSPMASGYIDKDPEVVYARGYCAFDCKVPINHLFLALFTYRHTWEKPYLVTLWADLVERGMDEDLAFFTTQFTISQLSGVGSNYTISYRMLLPCQSHHTLFFIPQDTIEFAYRYCTHQNKHESLKPYRENTGARDRVNSTFSANSKQSADSRKMLLKNVLREAKMGFEIEDKTTESNPFIDAWTRQQKRVTNRGGLATYEFLTYDRDEAVRYLETLGNLLDKYLTESEANEKTASVSATA